MNPVDTLTLLNRLITTTKNGESALEAAASEAWHEELKQSLHAYAQFFHQAAEELRVAAEKLGGHPHPRATFDNALHRTWLHLKALAYGRDEKTLLDEVEAEESRADELYAEVDHWDLPLELRALIKRQAETARRHHAQIHALRERLLH